MKCILIILVALLVVTSACKKGSDPAALKKYEFKGRIVEVTNREKKVLKISHEEVKDFMSAMTMNFPVRGDISAVEAGDEIVATLVYNATDNRSWLEDLKVVKKGAAAAAPSASPGGNTKVESSAPAATKAPVN